MEYKYHHSPPLEQGDEIRMFQEKLNTINDAFHGGWQRINPDGIFGRKTRDAIKGFQSFMNMSQTGNLDSMTQTAINYQIQQALHSHFRTNPYYGDTTYAPGIMNQFNQSRVRPTYEHLGVGSVVDNQTFHSKYNDSGLDVFVNGLKSWGNTLISSVVSLFNSVFEAKSVSYAVTIVKEQASQILLNFNRMKNDVLIRIGLMKGPNIWRWRDITYMLEQEAEKRIASATQKTEEAVKSSKAIQKGNPVGKVAGKVAWGLQILVVIYYLGKCIFGDDNEFNENFKRLRESFDSLLGSLMTTLIPKIAQIIATRIAMSAAVGTAGAPGVGTMVGVIVGIILTVVDLLLLWFTGETIGDKVMAKVREFVDSINIDKVVAYQQAAWTDPLTGRVSHNFL